VFSSLDWSAAASSRPLIVGSPDFLYVLARSTPPAYSDLIPDFERSSAGWTWHTDESGRGAAG